MLLPSPFKLTLTEAFVYSTELPTRVVYHMPAPSIVRLDGIFMTPATIYVPGGIHTLAPRAWASAMQLMSAVVSSVKPAPPAPKASMDKEFDGAFTGGETLSRSTRSMM